MSNEDRVDAKTDEANIYRAEYAKRIITFSINDAMTRRLLQHVFRCSERTTYDWIHRVKQDPDNFHSHPHTGRPPKPIPGKAMRKILEDADAKERNLTMREVIDATNSRLVSKGATFRKHHVNGKMSWATPWSAETQRGRKQIPV